MVDLASLIEPFQDAFIAKYADRLLPSHLNALHAIKRCRTADSGELQVRCSECGQTEWRPRSCGYQKDIKKYQKGDRFIF